MELSREVAQIFDSQHAPPPPASIECKNKKKNFPGFDLHTNLHAAAVKHRVRARSPGPQARGPQSQWTEAWPTQPAITQAVLCCSTQRAFTPLLHKRLPWDAYEWLGCCERLQISHDVMRERLSSPTC